MCCGRWFDDEALQGCCKIGVLFRPEAAGSGIGTRFRCGLDKQAMSLSSSSSRRFGEKNVKMGFGKI